MIIRPFEPTDAQPVFALQQKYAQANAGAPVYPGEMYLSPAFHGGQDVFCAYEGEHLLAYAPLYLQIVDGAPELPHMAWVEIKADPDLADSAPAGHGPLKDALLNCLGERARALLAALPADLPPHPLKMAFQYLPGETAAIEYVQSRGFAYTESVFAMLRSLNDPIPTVSMPEGVTLRRWKMAGEAEIDQYIEARNECFPEAPTTACEWDYFLGSPMWENGTTAAAFAGDELVGNVAVYWNAAENAQTGHNVGSTEFIFVRPGWRGKGIAAALIVEALHYLKEHGLDWAKLEVKALNANALGLYTRLGYTIEGESRFYQKMI